MAEQERRGQARPILSCCALLLAVASLGPLPVRAEIGIWSSAAELAAVPTAGPAWAALERAADRVRGRDATVSDQNSNHNARTLAAALVYARTGAGRYREVVVTALDTLVAGGRPPGRSLAWGRELGAYVMAADLVGYRTKAFEAWLRNIAEVWVASQGLTLLQTFEQRPNNWGSMAFGSLASVYRYLHEPGKLAALRDYWLQTLAGPPPPPTEYGADLSWHLDPARPRLINPRHAERNGFDLDGVIPDDMRRGNSFASPPVTTQYPWEHLQGLITAARVLERAGLPIWGAGDCAIYRAAAFLEVKLATRFDPAWRAGGDDVWMLPFLDRAYGSRFSETTSEPGRLWAHGKNAGWGVVVLADAASATPRPWLAQCAAIVQGPASAVPALGPTSAGLISISLAVLGALHAGRRLPRRRL